MLSSEVRPGSGQQETTRLADNTTCVCDVEGLLAALDVFDRLHDAGLGVPPQPHSERVVFHASREVWHGCAALPTTISEN